MKIFHSTQKLPIFTVLMSADLFVLVPQEEVDEAVYQLCEWSNQVVFDLGDFNMN